MHRFFEVYLRTSDVEAARAFYASVLGSALGALHIVKLHEQALARGARPHWLGFLEVGEVDRAAAAFTERGATLLGPKWVNPEGLEAATMRDPGGALVALAKPPAPYAPAAGAAEIVWYLLNTKDVETAKANYGELFGWEFAAPLDLGSHGVFHPFAWEPGGAAVGSMSDVGARDGRHPHWLFHFRVAALDPAVEVVRAAGGVVLGPFTLLGGDRIAVCDDPQGAAFALREAFRSFSTAARE